MIKNKITVPLLAKKVEQGEKIAMITCYDYAFATLLDASGVDILFVGDSLGDNVLGYDSTLPVTVEEIIHHARAVRRGTHHALVLADMPFMSYQINPEEALRNAGRMMKEAGIEAVKIEGGKAFAPTVRKLVESGVPVMGHVGLTPQSINVLGSYRIQGKSRDSAERILEDAQELSDAGAFAIVLELVPSELARQITEAISAATIGIGAGPHCDGQVLVMHDLLGLNPDRNFRHVRRYAEAGKLIENAARHFVEDVRTGVFPSEDNSN